MHTPTAFFLSFFLPLQSSLEAVCVGCQSSNPCKILQGAYAVNWAIGETGGLSGTLSDSLAAQPRLVAMGRDSNNSTTRDSRLETETVSGYGVGGRCVGDGETVATTV